MTEPSPKVHQDMTGKFAGWLLAISFAACCTTADAGPPGKTSQPDQPTGIVPKQIVTEVAEHEIQMLHYGAPFVRYRMHTVNARGEQVRDVIQSKDGAVARLISRDNRALTADEDTAEKDRLQAMVASPDNYLKHVREDTQGKKMAADIIRQMPDAMIFTYVEGQPQRPGHTGQPEVVVDYKPNPTWEPPTMAAGALKGLQGRMWVDPSTRSVGAIEGTIFREVNFGWGFLAQLYPGGTLRLEQSKVVADKWLFTHFVQHLEIRAMLVKKIHDNSDVTASEITQVSPMSYQDAVKILLAEPLPSH